MITFIFLNCLIAIIAAIVGAAVGAVIIIVMIVAITVKAIVVVNFNVMIATWFNRKHRMN